jgi:short-subunit dehydrogenase
MTYLIVGGSSGLGRALAERFAASGKAVLLISSDKRDGAAVAADLSLRHSVAARAIHLDLAAADPAYELIEKALAGLPPLEGMLLVAGVNRSNDAPGADDYGFELLTRVNYANPCKLINHFLPALTAARGGLVIGFGSIAATRGRGRNVAYSAAKRALESYFESLRHALSGTSVMVQFYILGYLDTNLAFAQNTPLPPASPSRCADHVFMRRQQDFGRAYFPAYWRPICAVLRWLPWFVYRRMSF